LKVALIVAAHPEMGATTVTTTTASDTVTANLTGVFSSPAEGFVSSVNMPLAVGVKVTAILHFAFDASDEPQVVPAEPMA